MRSVVSDKNVGWGLPRLFFSEPVEKLGQAPAYVRSQGSAG